MLNRFSITSQMIISLMVTSIFIVFFSMSFNIWYSVDNEKISFLRQSALETDLVADLVTAPLAFYDEEGVTQSLEHLDSHKDIKLALVYSVEKELIASFNPDQEEVHSKMPSLGIAFEGKRLYLWEFGQLNSTVEIKEKGQLLGYLHIEKQTDTITSFIISFVSTSALFLMGLITFVYILSRTLSKKILQPVLELAEVAKEVAETKDYSIRVSHEAKNEITSLYQAFNTLLIDTESLTENLEARVISRTQELEESLETLKNTQGQLLESEKMAALGNLVSGVAHEVNTPLGNALTGGSIIVHETKELMRHIDAGTMKKSTMMEGLETLNKSAEVLILSITRAANLIRSFKRISVDQSVEEKQNFNLFEYIEEILLTFHNKLKMVPVQTKLQGDHDLLIESYPGVYAQILSNLIQNSLLHGFETKKEDAQISISLEAGEKEFILIYEDNGEGMQEEMKKIAFEPFSTSKRNYGGTGLGLSIVYNLITQKLGGKIELTAEEEGVKYVISFPYSC